MTYLYFSEIVGVYHLQRKRMVFTMAYRTPSEMAKAVVESSVTKANADFASLAILGFLGGSFIALAGASAQTVSLGLGSWAGAGTVRFISGLIFSVGITMVIIGGAELFTGNSLMIIGLCERRITLARLLRSWIIVYFSNFLGALLVAWLYYGSELWMTPGMGIATGFVNSALSKAELAFWPAFARGVLCNWLVSMGVWMSYAAADVTGRIIPTAMAVSAFVMFGGEHSVANMFYLPAGFMIRARMSALPAPSIFRNMASVTLGNIVGGGLLVAAVYWAAYLRKGRK